MPRLLAALAVALPLGCVTLPFPAPGSAPATGEQPLYFATTVGTKWVYTLGDFFGPSGEGSWEVIGVEDVGGEKVVTVATTEVRHGGEPSKDRQVFAVSEKGVCQLTGDGRRVCLLRLPLQVGETWEFDDPPPAGGGYWTLETLAPKSIEVPAGKVRAPRVRMTRHLRPFWGFGACPDGLTFAATTRWYAPGVGIVKHTIEGQKEPTMLLKSFTPGNG